MPSKLLKGAALTRKTAERVVQRLALKERQLYSQFDARRSAFFKSYWGNIAKTVGAQIDDIGYEFFRLKRNNLTTYVQHGQVMIDDHLTLSLAGNKPLVHKLLVEQGYTVPSYLEYGLDEIPKAWQFMQQQQSTNFVVKPAKGGSGGRGITTKIDSKPRLTQSSYKAAIFSSNNKLIIEEELPGDNYRLLYLDGEYIDALRRESPTVSGDGNSSIKTLIDKENKTRLQSTQTLALSPLTLDLDSLFTLSDQGISSKSVPEKGHRVTVKTATNQYSKHENHSVKNEIHTSIIDYGREISKAINVRLSGVDLMIIDHKAPLEKSGCVVNEINTTPGLHHHALVSDTNDELAVGPVIIDYIFDQMQTQARSYNNKH